MSGQESEVWCKKIHIGLIVEGYWIVSSCPPDKTEIKKKKKANTKMFNFFSIFGKCRWPYADLNGT